MSGPVLATRDYTRNGEAERIIVNGGLQYIRGNKSPYFSLTCSYGTPRDYRLGNASGGCAHDETRKHFDTRFDDLAALHLSSIDGEPMYALENGFFRFYDQGATYSPKPDWAKRRTLLAEHFRIDERDVDAILLPLMGDGYSAHAGVFTGIKQARYWGTECPDAKARLAKWIETQRPRWKAEADACIAKHSLVVFGDEWKG